MGHKGVYNNGKLRQDSGENNAQRLTQEMVSSTLRGSNSTIMRLAAKRNGVEKEDEAATKLVILKILKILFKMKLILTFSTHPHLEPRKPRMNAKKKQTGRSTDDNMAKNGHGL